MKKMLSLLLALTLCVAFLVVPAAAEDASGTCGEGLTWHFSEATGTLTVSGTGAMDNFQYNKAPWSDRRGDIRSVVLEEGVTGIGAYAFNDFSQLTDVTIPDSVESIGFCAFQSCGALQSLTIPAGVTFINNMAFYITDSLSDLRVAEDNPKYKAVDNVLFSKDGKLLLFCAPTKTGSYAIPDGVEVLQLYAFMGCNALTDISIPASVTRIGDGAFANCSSLTSLQVAADNPSFQLLDGMIYSKSGDTLVACPGAREGEVTVRSDVTTIGQYAFFGCFRLTAITIPVSVTLFDGFAFSGMSNKTEINYAGTEAQWKAIEVKNGNSSLEHLTVHYNAGAAPANKVVLSPQNLAVDGKDVDCMKYNINGSNFFKLRDLAQLLNGTGSQFDVGWDNVKKIVSITTNHAYTKPDGHELEIVADASASAVVSAQTIMIDGVVRDDLEAWNIGGSNYFKLRDLGDVLGFDVDYVKATNTAFVVSR